MPWRSVNGGELQLHSLTLALNIAERSASHFARFTHFTHRIAGSAGNKSILVVYKKEKYIPFSEIRTQDLPALAQ